MLGACTGQARETARYKLDIVVVQDVRWHKEGTVRAGDYNFLYKKKIVNWELDFCTPQNSISS